jgi:hypothetical protein
VGYINPVLESRETTVDGYPARVSVLADGKLETNPESTYEYVVALSSDLRCEDTGRYIYAFTKRDYPGDYETNKAALDQVMQSLEVGALRAPGFGSNMTLAQGEGETTQASVV